MTVSGNEMKLFVLLSICIYPCQGFCPDDIDLETSRCQCNLNKKMIQCSNLPNRCRTCYRYRHMLITDQIEILPKKALNFYHFDVFTIEFSRLKTLSTQTFLNLVIQENHHLQIRIVDYQSSNIPTKLFQNMTLQSKAKFTFEILKVPQSILTIQPYAFEGILFNSHNQFQFSVHSANKLIQFERNAGLKRNH